MAFSCVLQPRMIIEIGCLNPSVVSLLAALCWVELEKFAVIHRLDN